MYKRYHRRRTTSFVPVLTWILSFSLAGVDALRSTPLPDSHWTELPRRAFVQRTVASIGLAIGTSVGVAPDSEGPDQLLLPERAWAVPQSADNLASLLSQLKEAKGQLEKSPPLIESEKWDTIRTILSEAPLVDIWGKKSTPLLTNYVEALGDAEASGIPGVATDAEFLALEAREDLVSHLRYFDAACYSNVFNPITVEGKSGATKQLIDSYYNDPVNEYKASLKLLDRLIGLAGSTP